MTLLEKNLRSIKQRVDNMVHTTKRVLDSNIIPSCDKLLLELNASKNSILSNGIWVDTNNNNAITLNNATKDSDNTLLLNGTSTYFNTNISQSSLVNGYTIAIRFKPTQWNNYKGLWGYHSSYGTGLVGFQHEDTVLSMSHIYSGMTDENVVRVPVSEFPLNNWYTIILTYDLNNTRFYYKDNIIEDKHFKPLQAYDYLYIGKAYNTSDRYFKGNISHVIVYNRALEKEEALELYDYINAEVIE